MTVERIDCANDSRLAPYRDVGDGELLRERRLFVAEGRLVVRRAIEDRRYAIRSLLVNDAALNDLAPAIARRARCGPATIRRRNSSPPRRASRWVCASCPSSRVQQNDARVTFIRSPWSDGRAETGALWSELAT